MSELTQKHAVGLYDLSKLTKNELIGLIDQLREKVKETELKFRMEQYDNHGPFMSKDGDWVHPGDPRFMDE